MDMDLTPFLIDLAETLEVEVSVLQESYDLTENENWDSLAFISVLVMLDEHFKITLENGVLKNCRTVGDLVHHIRRREEKILS